MGMRYCTLRLNFQEAQQVCQTAGDYIAEFDFLPWFNTKFSVQYIAYNKFNGSNDNYDGAGRNASDNNSLYALAWIAF